MDMVMQRQKDSVRPVLAFAPAEVVEAAPVDYVSFVLNLASSMFGEDILARELVRERHFSNSDRA